MIYLSLENLDLWCKGELMNLLEKFRSGEMSPRRILGKLRFSHGHHATALQAVYRSH